MGWKGTVRSVGAAMRAAERESKRRQRELERQQKDFAKMQELEQAAFEVEVYENHIEVILSTHKECSPVVDWEKAAASPEPKKPKLSSDNQENARLKADSYKPGFLDRRLKREKKKRDILEQAVATAIQADEKMHHEKLEAWERELEDWRDSVEIANALLSGEAKSKIEAIENLQPFSEISNLGSSLSIGVHDNGILEATIHVHGTDIVPSEVKSLLKSGKLSVKKMPKGQFNEIYQDYVCSCVLRVGNELFSTLPDSLVLVTAVDELLNSQTGHQEAVPILSVAVSRSTMQKLNLQAIDPSDSMNNFSHNMLFKKTKGFEKVDRIDSGSLDCP